MADGPSSPDGHYHEATIAAIDRDRWLILHFLWRQVERQRAAGRAGGTGLAKVGAGMVGLISTFFSW